MRQTFFIVIVSLFVFTGMGRSAESNGLTVRIDAPRSALAGSQTVVMSLYDTPAGGAPLWTESRVVYAGPRGEFATAFDAPPHDEGDRWLEASMVPGTPSRRVRIPASDVAQRVVVQALAPAHIQAVGIIASTEGGFRFPDTSLQMSAAVPATTLPLALGASNPGTASTYARADHVHAHGSQAGGALHAPATPSTAGFMSAADKTKLNALPAYVRTIVVSPVPGNPTASGTALRNALNGITTNSAANPYLLKLEPGVYNIGSVSPLVMKPYTDIEGSGQDTTSIVGSLSSSAVDDAAVVAGASNTELRNLTITNNGGASLTFGILARNLTATIRDVTINVVNGTQTIGVYCLNSSPSALTMLNTTIHALGATGTTTTGIYASAGTIEFRSGSITASGGATNRAFDCSNTSAVVMIVDSVLTATADGGDRIALYVDGGNVVVRNSMLTGEGSGTGSGVGARTGPYGDAIVTIERSSIRGVTRAIEKGATSSLRVAASQVDSISSGNPTCIYTYTPAFAPTDSTCSIPLG